MAVSRHHPGFVEPRRATRRRGDPVKRGREEEEEGTMSCFVTLIETRNRERVNKTRGSFDSSSRKEDGTTPSKGRQIWTDVG